MQLDRILRGDDAEYSRLRSLEVAEMTPKDDMILIARGGLEKLLGLVEQRVNAYAKLSNRSRILEPVLLSEVWHAAGVCYGEHQRELAARKLSGADLQRENPSPTADLVELALEQVGMRTSGLIEEEILANALLRDFATYAVAFHAALIAVTDGDKIRFLGGFQSMSEHVHTTFKTASRNKRRTIRMVDRDTVRIQIG